MGFLGMGKSLLGLFSLLVSDAALLPEVIFENGRYKSFSESPFLKMEKKNGKNSPHRCSPGGVLEEESVRGWTRGCHYDM